MKKNFKWILFVSDRFSKVDRKSRSSVTSKLASVGVCFGVMALIVVMSVMNGFQMSFIDSIMEISSNHIRVGNVQDEEAFWDYVNDNENITSCTPFYEAQGLLVGATTTQVAGLIRAVPTYIMEYDKGFAKEINVISGTFDLTDEDNIVVGSTLAHNLGVHVGSTLSILALSGSSDVSLISEDRLFVVTGIFSCGYADINNAYCFISTESGERHFGSSPKKIFGIKIKNSNNDSQEVSMLQKLFPEAECVSWRNYNRSFFGALRIEKNMLTMLVFLIFVVVAVNIYNGMRRMVYERSQEIAVLSALGAKKSDIQKVFIAKGFITGFKGALPGLLGGLFICVNMEKVFMGLSKIQYWCQLAVTKVFSPGNISYVVENPMYRIYASIPARMIPSEILMIFFFGIFSSLAASYLAGRKILKLTVVEVLRDE